MKRIGGLAPVYNHREVISALADRKCRKFPNAGGTSVVHPSTLLRCVGFRTRIEYRGSAISDIRPVGVNANHLVVWADMVAKALHYLENLTLAASGKDSLEQISTDGAENSALPEMPLCCNCSGAEGAGHVIQRSENWRDSPVH